MNEDIRMAVPQPFNYAEMLSYMSRSTNECMLHIENNKIYKLIEADDSVGNNRDTKNIMVEISSEQEGSLIIRFLDERAPLNNEMLAKVTSHIREWFDLDTDLNLFYEQVQHDLLLQKVISRFYGLRIIGISNLFEALCWGVIGQQINLTFAYTLKRRFVEAFGEYVEWNGRKYWVFPTPDKIALLQLSDLTSLQMTTKKSEYLMGIAQLMVDGKLSKAQLLNLKDYKMMEKQLISIRGIGPWTANYVLMRCLRASSAFPIDDVGLHNAIKHLLELDRKPSLEEIKQLSAAWTNWEAYATFYLWRSLY